MDILGGGIVSGGVVSAGIINGNKGTGLPPPSHVIYVYDTFTDVNGTQLTDHTPEIGGPWFIDGIGSIQNNEYVQGFSATFMLGIAAGVTDVKVSADCWGDTASAEPGVGVRHINASNNFHCFHTQVGNLFSLNRMLAGISVELDSASDPAIVQDVWFSHELTIVGDSLTATIASLGLTLTATDANHPAATDVVMRSSLTNGKIDNFKAETP